ncbi:uncharacterized protein SCHCODRAFT_02063320 [Schizophyllum commune H4-8]|uniref:uncharacterized protein n=1 Tax=Schizophyllum commune (strain H4-8 / FGSC 9210) TaxID=578458 RepID=UPI0021601AE2|nr:uncharacterized protein SCHCODRAFT_02063320 [Schizophyllum commune H4-8]KAI5888815.1 hypothetical protein SCHCODRAFT_02063320 [Schizophyllum commune H4-8]
MGEDSLDEDSLAYDAPHAEGHQLQAFTRSPLGRLSHRSRRPPPASLAPIIWRCLVFQLMFCTVHVLASVSTIVDVARQRSPTCFGTTEVAMILAGWAPAILFGASSLCPSSLGWLFRIRHAFSCTTWLLVRDMPPRTRHAFSCAT